MRGPCRCQSCGCTYLLTAVSSVGRSADGQGPSIRTEVRAQKLACPVRVSGWRTSDQLRPQGPSRTTPPARLAAQGLGFHRASPVSATRTQTLALRCPCDPLGFRTNAAIRRMCCARIINGIGTGHLNAIVPVWSAEVATHTSRGAFIASEFTLNIFGVVVAYWLEFGLGFIGDGTSQVRWRVRNFNPLPCATPETT